MVTEPTQIDLVQGERGLVLAWIAFTAAVAVGSGAAWLAAGTTLPDPPGGPWPAGLHAAAVGLAAASLVARMRLLSDRRLGAFAAAPGGQLASWARPAFVLGWSCNATIAALGAALAVATGDPQALAPFAFAALVLNVLAFPRLAPYRRRIEALGTGR